MFHKKPKKKGRKMEEDVKQEEDATPEQPPVDLKQCSACNAWYAKGDERCPNCGSAEVK